MWGNGLLLNYKDIFQGYDDTKRDFSHNVKITLFPFLRPDSNSLGMGRRYYLCFNNSNLLPKSTLMWMHWCNKYGVVLGWVCMLKTRSWLIVGCCKKCRMQNGLLRLMQCMKAWWISSRLRVLNNLPGNKLMVWCAKMKQVMRTLWDQLFLLYTNTGSCPWRWLWFYNISIQLW